MWPMQALAKPGVSGQAAAARTRRAGVFRRLGRARRAPPERPLGGPGGPQGRFSGVWHGVRAGFRIMSDKAILSDIASPRQAGRIPRHKQRDKPPRKTHHAQVIRADLDLLADPPPDLQERLPAPPAKRARAKPSHGENPGTASLSAAGADPGLGAGERKGRGGRSAVCRRRRARFARRLPAPRPARRRGAARPPGAAERRRLRQNPAPQRRRSRAARPPLRRRRPARARGEPPVAVARWRRPAAQPRPRPDLRRGGAARPGCPDPNGLAASLKACAGEGDPVSAAAKAAALAFSAFPDAPAAEAEILALWAFDIALAIRLRWPRPVPLIAVKILDPTLRPPGASRRPRPGDPAWPNAAAGAIALAAASALDLAADLARRSDTLIAVAPKLRARNRPQKIVDLLLAQDCVSPAEAARHAPMTGRAARRLFDRLVSLGAAREFSGPAHVPAVRPMSAAARRRRREGDETLDVELFDLPPAARWREWMLRVEAADLRLAKTRGPRGARPPGRRSLPVRRSDRRSHPRAARPPLRSHPGRRRLCFAHQNPLRPGDPRRPSRPRKGRRRRADPDRDLCLDRDRLSAAGDAGGDFQAGGTRDQPRRHRRPQAPRPDRRRDPRPSARRARSPM